MSASSGGRIITVHAFRGDRTSAFTRLLFQAIDDERYGRGRGPTETECLLFTGHAGVSTDASGEIYGFNPIRGADRTWQVMEKLRNGGAYSGTVRDDSAVFAAAEHLALKILRFDIQLSIRSHRTFRRKLNGERRHSRYSYGFPDGDGDCNCTTWIERLGLPLLTGRMDEFTAVAGVESQIRCRFGAPT